MVRRRVPDVGVHRKLWHRHAGVKFLATALLCEKRVNKRLTRFRMGTLCDFCGWNPEENALRRRQQTFEKILRQKGIKTLWDRL